MPPKCFAVIGQNQALRIPLLQACRVKLSKRSCTRHDEAERRAVEVGGLDLVRERVLLVWVFLRGAAGAFYIDALVLEEARIVNVVHNDLETELRISLGPHLPPLAEQVAPRVVFHFARETPN